MRIEEIKDPDEIREIVPIIKSAWGFTELDSLVKDIVVAMKFHGGVVIGAYDGDRLVGMNFGFPGRRNNYDYLYSHMTGVLEDQKYSGIGYRMKMYQKEWARSHGYDMIAWTYDPLMSLNANFNIHKLGAFSRTFLTNFYGEMGDRINAGIRTDRFVAELWLELERPIVKGEAEIALDMDGVVSKRITEIAAHSGRAIVHVPENFNEVKKMDSAEAAMWREASKKVFESLFNAGFVALDFHRGENPHYTLARGDFLPEKMRKNVFK
ncbi:hypothetical protein Thermo_00883 [Thermoplasmatales archaeon]|nr:hypothetical protein Thermo_00883 [Thermoplasmatales archaeon]